MRPRCARGESSLTNVAATGSSPPSPSPAMMRAASSVSNVGASAESKLPREKITSVTVKTARRPYRSARRPAAAAPMNMPTKVALATRPTPVASSLNSPRIGVSRKLSIRTSIASNIHPSPDRMSKRQWKRFSGTRSRRATNVSAAALNSRGTPLRREAQR